MSKLVYLAGPIGANDDGRLERIRTAIVVADALWNAGVYPFVPHLSHWFDEQYPRSYAEWMRYDAAWLRKCDALFRIPGHSPGADAEVAMAGDLSLPVFYSLDALKRWADGVGE